MIRIVMAWGWVATLYSLTAVTAGLIVGPPSPPNATAAELARSAFWFEANHVVLHMTCFAVLMGIMALGNRRILSGREWWLVAALVALSLLVGVGQEVLQSAIRAKVALDNSLFDIACDAAGALITLAVIWGKRGTARTQATALSRS